jgi:uncharacterized membrane protein
VADPSREPLGGGNGWIAWGIAAAFSPGWAAYAWTRGDTEALVRANDPAAVSLGAAASFMMASAALIGALWWWLVRREGATGLAALRRAVLRTRVVVLAPLLVVLLADGSGFLGMRRPLLVLAAAALVAWTLPAWPRVPPRLTALALRLLGGRRFPIVVLVLATTATAMVLVRLALLRHLGLHTRAFDLGIYDNTVWNTLHGDFLGCSLIRSGSHTAAHFDPILAVVALPYALAPRAEALIVIQALWVLSSVVPVYLIARDRLGERAGAVLVAACLLAYPSVHGVILYEFHSLTLLAPAALWLVLAIDRGSAGGWIAALGMVLLVREDAALFAIGVGIWAALATDRRRLGLLTIAIAIAWLVVVKAFFMPDPGLLMQHSDEAYAYANRYRRLIPEGGGAADAVSTLVTNPSFVLGHVLAHDKFMAFVAFLLPLGLLPLLAGKRLLPCVYGAAFLFLASHASLYFPLFHYASALYPMLVAALPAGIVHARRILEARGQPPALARRRVHAWLATCAVASTLSMGGFVPNAPFELHTPIPRHLDSEARATYAWLRGAVESIPVDASVSASNRTAPHLSNRADVHILQEWVATEFILLHDEDVGGPERSFLRSHAEQYEEIDRHGPLRLLRRGAPPW